MVVYDLNEVSGGGGDSQFISTIHRIQESEHNILVSTRLQWFPSRSQTKAVVWARSVCLLHGQLH